MSTNMDIQATLNAIDPSACSYEEWVQVGMALHAAGEPMTRWEDWSRRDAGRFNEHDFEKKWKGFTADNGITIGTLAHIAEMQGSSAVWEMPRVFDWGMTEAVISPEDMKLVDESYLEHVELPNTGMAGWEQLAAWIKAVFRADELVGWVSDTGTGKPASKGHWMPADKIIRGLEKYKSIPDALSDSVIEDGHGVWIRFNPLDGGGVRNDNVTDYRYALVESDGMEQQQQLAMIQQMKLPCAAITSSGGKSVHAIVHVDAPDMATYKERVSYLYDVLTENGFAVDTQNKNPSRLSRMPGVMRGSTEQTLISVNEGCASWAEWIEYIEGVTDTLPDIVTWQDVRDDLPELAPELIEGVLRRGHKMLIAGPSKVGKSWLLVQLARAIACGSDWLGMHVACGHVVYINLEIDKSSFLHRIATVDEVLSRMPDEAARRLHTLPLRGHADAMSKLAPRIISKCERLGEPIVAIIIDPLYKVMPGDENAAGDVRVFMNTFDAIAERLGCSMIICHHFSKGSQEGKRALDMASGSGVFGRDPDASLALIPVRGTEDGWKLSFSLREFKDPEPLYLRFEWPIHVVDPYVEEEEQNAPKMTRADQNRQRAIIERESVNIALRQAARMLAYEGREASISGMLEKLDGAEVNGKPVSEKKLRKWLSRKESPWCVAYYDATQKKVFFAPEQDELEAGW